MPRLMIPPACGPGVSPRTLPPRCRAPMHGHYPIGRSTMTSPRRYPALVAIVLATSIATASASPAQNVTRRDTSVVQSRRGVVVSVSGLASDVGAAILARGGNAVDAAVATGFALAVTHPSAGNLGGGGFMIVRTADGTATTFDYREKAPAAATPTMYLKPDGTIDRSLTRAGWLAPGVPGTVRGLALAHKKFGKLPWADVVRPAARLALG